MIQFIFITISVLRYDYKEIGAYWKSVKAADQDSVPRPQLYFFHIPGTAVLILIFLVIGGVSSTPLRIIAGNVIYVYIFWFTEKIIKSTVFRTYGEIMPAAGLYLMLFSVSYFIFFITGRAISVLDNATVQIIIILLSSFMSALACSFFNYIYMRFIDGDGMQRLIINHSVAASFIMAVSVLKDSVFFEFNLLWILSFIPFLFLCGYTADYIINFRQEKNRN